MYVDDLFSSFNVNLISVLIQCDICFDVYLHTATLLCIPVTFSAVLVIKKVNCILDVLVTPTDASDINAIAEFADVEMNGVEENTPVCVCACPMQIMM